jgi:hypothetical protein
MMCNFTFLTFIPSNLMSKSLFIVYPWVKMTKMIDHFANDAKVNMCSDFILWGGDLPHKHGYAILYLVSLEKMLVSRSSLVAPPHHQWALDLFTPEA